MVLTQEVPDGKQEVGPVHVPHSPEAERIGGEDCDKGKLLIVWPVRVVHYMQSSPRKLQRGEGKSWSCAGPSLTSSRGHR